MHMIQREFPSLPIYLSFETTFTPTYRTFFFLVKDQYQHNPKLHKQQKNVGKSLNHLTSNQYVRDSIFSRVRKTTKK